MVRIVKQGGDRRAAAGVAGQDHIAADVSFGAVNMKLLFQLLHE